MLGCLAPLDRTGQVDGASVQQELLSQCGLTCIRVGNDCKCPPLFYLFCQLAIDKMFVLRFPLCKIGRTLEVRPKSSILYFIMVVNRSQGIWVYKDKESDTPSPHP